MVCKECFLQLDLLEPLLLLLFPIMEFRPYSLFPFKKKPCRCAWQDRYLVTLATREDKVHFWEKGWHHQE